VTPELAAQIVKHFIIPMFDSENKKDLRKKYNEMAGIKSAASTVLGDLKLTETLSNELEGVRNQVDNLKEKLEEVTVERDIHCRELTQLKVKFLQQKKMIGILKGQLGLSFKIRSGVELQTE
jgi:hypothetical protein